MSGAWLIIGWVLPAISMHAQAVGTLNRHSVRVDGRGRLLSWVRPQSSAYDQVVRLAVNFLEHQVPTGPGGLPLYYSWSTINSTTLKPIRWPNNPAGMRAMMADSARRYYAYSGDRAFIGLVTRLLDYQLAHGTTPKGWPWARVPYASSEAGSLVYQGTHANEYWKKPNVGDGWHAIEPDKVGELGYACLQWYELTGRSRYRRAALQCAGALARHVQAGDAMHSPWPFRVNAQTGRVIDGYSSNVIGPIRLFTGLIDAHMGDLNRWRRARRVAWAWLMQYPMRNQRWSGYFEDVYTVPAADDWNQYSPMETTLYLMRHPEADPNWRRDVPSLIHWVERTLVVDVPKEPAVQWGANAVSEQRIDMNKMGSHTSRYAVVKARWYELTGDRAARRTAFRSLNWATYMCRRNGRVVTGPIDQSIWFTDGYGDYIRHFLMAMAAVPEWAPEHQNHLLGSTSVVQTVRYAPTRVAYRTFQSSGDDVLRLGFRPRQVRADGQRIPTRAKLRASWTLQRLPDGDFVLRIHRRAARHIAIDR